MKNYDYYYWQKWYQKEQNCQYDSPFALHVFFVEYDSTRFGFSCKMFTEKSFGDKVYYQWSN